MQAAITAGTRRELSCSWNGTTRQGEGKEAEAIHEVRILFGDDNPIVIPFPAHLPQVGEQRLKFTCKVLPEGEKVLKVPEDKLQKISAVAVFLKNGIERTANIPIRQPTAFEGQKPYCLYLLSVRGQVLGSLVPETEISAEETSDDIYQITTSIIGVAWGFLAGFVQNFKAGLTDKQNNLTKVITDVTENLSIALKTELKKFDPHVLHSLCTKLNLIMQDNPTDPKELLPQQQKGYEAILATLGDAFLLDVGRHYFRALFEKRIPKEVKVCIETAALQFATTLKNFTGHKAA